MPTAEAKKKITAWLEAKGLGKKTINYKLRDWLFSRQRYWGEPFPIVWKRDRRTWKSSYHEALPESALPVLPPTLDRLQTHRRRRATAGPREGLGEKSARRLDCAKRTPCRNGPARAGIICVISTRKTPVRSSARKRKIIGWRRMAKSAGVDLYVGGTEHAVLHLLYARFWHKVLFDLGYVSTPEPFFKLVNQGMMLGEDNQKMSKSRGNVIPEDVPVQEFGTDALRLYEMFMGPLEMVKPWSTKGVEGVYRFLGRVWRLFVDEKAETAFEQAETTTKEPKQPRIARFDSAGRRHHGCRRHAGATQGAARLHQKSHGRLGRHALQHGDFRDDGFCQRGDDVADQAGVRDEAVFAIARAVRAASRGRIVGAACIPPSASRRTSLAYAPWPKFDPALLVESEIEIPVQVNGKLRDVIKVPADADNATIEAAAKASEKVQPFIAGKTHQESHHRAEENGEFDCRLIFFNRQSRDKTGWTGRQGVKMSL